MPGTTSSPRSPTPASVPSRSTCAGYGASDKPPRGYDGYTMAGDVAGLIRALGERTAYLVGAGYGGMIGWATAAFHPKLVRRLVVLGAAHPLRLRAALATDPRGQLAAAGPVLKFQLPRFEHVLTRNNAALVGEYMAMWGGPDWVGTDEYRDYERCCREAMRIPQAAFCALETYRWAARSALRLQGYRFVKQLQTADHCTYAAAARRARHRRPAPHRTGLGTLRAGGVRMAPVARRRTLPSSGAAGTDHRRDPALEP